MNPVTTFPRTAMISGAFIWIGLVCGISFIESWLKFQAPGITLDLGVGIGQLVFSALNKVEIAIAGIIAIAWWYTNRGGRRINSVLLALGVAITVLIIQTTILLPAMDARAEMRFSEVSPPPSFLHFYYVGGEIIKVVCLSIFGIKTIQ